MPPKPPKNARPKIERLRLRTCRRLYTAPHMTTLTFQQIILRLQDYWDRQGCALLQPYDMEVG
ncbi:MAG: glycine--tRNA ligase subunit alpha, partial [Betaproteobacteria bacterium]